LLVASGGGDDVPEAVVLGSGAEAAGEIEEEEDVFHIYAGLHPDLMNDALSALL
jgi:hypothetical protein